MSRHLLAFALTLLPLTAYAQAQGPALPPQCAPGLAAKDEIERGGNAYQAAIKRKSQPEACEALKTLAGGMGKMVKFAETEGAWCGVPPQGVAHYKSEQSKIIKARDQVCSGGAVGQARPAAPSLSEALSSPRLPDASKAQSGRGTFDTLQGNPLIR